MMDIQYNTELSPRSKAILYHLKQALAQKGISISNHVCNIFQYQKTKFNRKQFHQIILQFDRNIVLQQIDGLFNQLDDNKNQFVFLESIISGLESITEDDNPYLALNRRSKLILENTNKKTEIQVLIQVKDLLLQSEDYLEVIGLFVTERDGFLNKDNVIEILRNFEYNDKQKQNIFIDAVFQSKNKVEIKDLLQRLGLQAAVLRINTPVSPKKQKKMIQQDKKSDYIKNQQKSKIRQPFLHELQQNFMIQSIKSNRGLIQNSIHYNIQNIPQVLQPFFNYGSQLQQPFATFAAQYISKNTIFIDSENPTYARARRWVHIMQVKPYYQLFQVAKSLIKRDKNRKGLGAMLQPKDIIQGGFGDCYFLSAVAAIVQDYPQLVYRLFVLEHNPSHLFGVKLFIDGIWRTIPLDGCFPINNHGAFCGAQPHHDEIWVMLLEKAWAKVYKSYQNIYSGYNQEGLLAISGAPTISLSSKKQGFLRRVISEFGKGSIITCATSKQVTQLTQKQQQNLGVFAGHAYTLMKVYQNIPYKDTTVTLIKIRNPWGRKGWKGDWSFNSSLWTKQLKRQLGYEVDPSDGTFFVGFNDFVIYFDYINISKVNLSYRHSHVSNKSGREDFYENRFKIKQNSDYFFTLYQQNGRKYKNMSGVYQKSKSWFFLAKINQKSQSGSIIQLTAIACSCTSTQNNTIQTTLQPGEYVLISKVCWKYWQSHTYTITSYGPSKIIFTQGQYVQPQLINKFIESRAEEIAKHDGGKASVYDNTNVSKRYYFSIEDGIGFITIYNFDEKLFETQINMNPCRGLTILQPYSLPLDIIVMPFQTQTVGFIIDPEGYQYSMKQKYHLRRVR